jgi:hypothetical protein
MLIIVVAVEVCKRLRLILSSGRAIIRFVPAKLRKNYDLLVLGISL